MTKRHDGNPDSHQDAIISQNSNSEAESILGPAYDAPEGISLEELARGSGSCTSGSAGRAGCTNGVLAGSTCLRGGPVVVWDKDISPNQFLAVGRMAANEYLCEQFPCFRNSMTDLFDLAKHCQNPRRFPFSM
jgi:hypothetical protein